MDLVSSSLAQEDTMTDISSIAATNTRCVDLPQQRLPRLTVGELLGAIVGLIADAHRMAYVDPFTGRGRQPHIFPNDELEGRDPNW